MSKRKKPKIPRAGGFVSGGWKNFSCYSQRLVTARVWAKRISTELNWDNNNATETKA